MAAGDEVVTQAGEEEDRTTLEGPGAEGCHVVPHTEVCHLVALLGEEWAGVEHPEGHLLVEVACLLHPPEVAQLPALDHLHQGHQGCSLLLPSPTSNTSSIHHKHHSPNRMPMKNILNMTNPMLSLPMRATIITTVNNLHPRILNTMITDTERLRSQHMNHMLKMIGRDSGPAVVKEAKHLLPGQEPREPTENTHTEDTE